MEAVREFAERGTSPRGRIAVSGAYDRVFSVLPANGFRCGARSHIGRKRENQDEVRLPGPEDFPATGGCLFAVADGMGGHKGGRIASRTVCESLDADIARIAGTSGCESAARRRLLEETVLRAGRRLRLAGREDPALEEMGTTLSCLMLTERNAIVAHAGDSRIYRLRNGHLTRLTTDHTFVQDMVFEGDLSPDAAATHPLRHMLTRALGAMETLEQVDTRIDPRRAEDRYLLCTDGLHDVVGKDRIEALLAADRLPARIARNLVDDALKTGGRDNITAVVILPA